MSNNNEKNAEPGADAADDRGEGTRDNLRNDTGTPESGHQAAPENKAEFDPEAPESSDAETQEGNTEPRTAASTSDDAPPSGMPNLRMLLPTPALPDQKSLLPKHEMPGRLTWELREANRISSFLEEHSRFTKHLDLVNRSAAKRALDEFNDSAAARAVQQLDKLRLPTGSAIDEIINGYRSHFERQLEPIQELLKNRHATDRLASFRDGFARQYADSYLLSDTARRFAKLDQESTASLAAAAAVKLREPGFHAFITLRESLDKNSDVSALIRSFQAPWAKLDDLLGSAIGVAEANILFAGVHHHDPFGERITEYLRFELGDYRDASSWDEDRVLDSAARLEFYSELGLRDELRDTPPEVLIEAESKVVIARPAADILTPFSFRALFTSDGLEPYLMACKALRILERRLRDVINAEMTKTYGTNWIMSTLKKDIRDAWIEKQEKAVRQGRPKDPLIEYADFTEYSLIITGKPQWEGVFKFVFKRQEDVRESLYRLGPVRIAAFHTREVLDMDILALAAEGTRLMRALETVPT